MPCSADAHPWLRIERVVRWIRVDARRWGDETWRELTPALPSILAEREKVRAAGWFN
ncbi:MAG: hypothetical protein ACREJG_02660 [Candidatus Rokuibacteriota bacterium]